MTHHWICFCGGGVESLVCKISVTTAVELVATAEMIIVGISVSLQRFQFYIEVSGEHFQCLSLELVNLSFVEMMLSE